MKNNSNMIETTKREKIIVVSNEAGVADLVKAAVGDSFDIISIPDPARVPDAVRKERPSLIVLNYLEPPGAASQLYFKLKEGWSTRNTPVLVIETKPRDSSERALIAEVRNIAASDYLELPQSSSNFLKEALEKRLKQSANKFKDALLDPDVFCITWEQIPSRGAFEVTQEEVIDNAYKAAGKGKIHAISMTDNPSGIPAISPEMLSTEIKKAGIEPLVHFALRDKNRNECESLLHGLSTLNVKNLLILTGDHTSPTGFKGKGKPVFDLDSVQGLQLVEALNAGLEYDTLGKKAFLAHTDFFAGAAMSPFKQTEEELMGQYYKLKKKIEAGAKFIINQVGYDARKLDEQIRWLKINNYRIPLMANIYILSPGPARTMNANKIPGCVVTDKLLTLLEEERKENDKGKSTRLDRAAKMYAIAQGMGCSGAHIGGYGVNYEMVEYVINKGEELAPKWQELVSEFDFPQKDGFYLFKKDDKTGLNTSDLAPRPSKPSNPPIYTMSDRAHKTLFNPASIIFRGLLPVAKSVDKGPKMKRAFGKFEHVTKVVLFDCMDCGDCALFDVAYLCPMSQCPKGQRNGPCGGSFAGWCEVYPGEKKCIWVRAYQRLKKHQKENSIVENIVPPCDWELEHTSSWLNYYLGRDHAAKRLGIKPPEKKVADKSPKVS